MGISSNFERTGERIRSALIGKRNGGKEEKKRERKRLFRPRRGSDFGSANRSNSTQHDADERCVRRRKGKEGRKRAGKEGWVLGWVLRDLDPGRPVQKHKVISSVDHTWNTRPASTRRLLSNSQQTASARGTGVGPLKALWTGETEGKVEAKKGN